MLLAGLTSTASKSKKNSRTLADTKLEMEVISQSGSGGLDDCKPSQTNLARMKQEGRIGVVEYSRITIPDSVNMGKLKSETKRVRHCDFLGGERNRLGAVVKNLLEGGTPEIL